MVPGIRPSWELVADQLKGQRAIVSYQREELAIPEICQVYKLNTPNGQTSQFVRVASVDHSVVTFTYNNGSEFVDFERRKIEMQISAPLIETFPGAQPVPGVPGNNASLVQTTQVADSSRYYTIQPVSASITTGLTIETESIYATLVPSAKVASSWLDQAGGYSGKAMVATANRNRSVSCGFVHISGNQRRMYVQRGVLPKTLFLSLDGGTFEEDGAGNLLHTGGRNNYSKLTIDYALGKWQDIGDTGAGQMDGAGSGSILFVTGSAAITLDAMPDSDSAIVFSYLAQNDEESWGQESWKKAGVKSWVQVFRCANIFNYH